VSVPSGAETGAKALVEQARWEERCGVGGDLELGISLGVAEQLDGLGVGCEGMGGDAVVVEAWIAVLLSLPGARDRRWQRVFARSRRSGPACP
jgi:hypothetical protein